MSEQNKHIPLNNSEVIVNHLGVEAPLPPEYNPELVTYYDNPNTDEHLALVTRDKMEHFLAGSDLSTTQDKIFIENLDNNLRRGIGANRKHGYSDTSSFYSFDIDEQGKYVVRGLRADKIRELAEGLSTGNLRFNGVGEKGVIYLGHLADALQIRETV